MLEDYAAVAERVTLLHSSEIGKEFKILPMQLTKIDTIFGARFQDCSKTAPSVTRQTPPQTDSTLVATKKTWASLAGGNGNSDEAHTPVRTNDSPVGLILVNAAGHRVDAKLPQPSKAASGLWDHKVNKIGLRFCRMYQLNSGCRGNCGYSHGPLSDEEKLVYRRQLRGEVCHIGLKCRDANCYYGHNCSCKKLKCKFRKEMHDVDGETATVWSG